MINNLKRRAEDYIDKQFEKESRLPKKYACICLRGVITDAKTGLIGDVLSVMEKVIKMNVNLE